MAGFGMTTTDAHPWPEARPSAPEELDGPFALCVPMQVQMARFHELRTRDPSAAAASLEWGKKLADLAARGELDALRAECLGAAGLSVARPLADATEIAERIFFRIDKRTGLDRQRLLYELTSQTSLPTMFHDEERPRNVWIEQLALARAALLVLLAPHRLLHLLGPKLLTG